MAYGRNPIWGLYQPANVKVSLVAQMVRNLPAMQDTWIQSLGWEDPLEKIKASHYSILVQRIHGLYIVHGVTKSQAWLRDFHSWNIIFTFKALILSNKKIYIHTIPQTIYLHIVLSFSNFFTTKVTKINLKSLPLEKSACRSGSNS